MNNNIFFVLSDIHARKRDIQEINTRLEEFEKKLNFILLSNSCDKATILVSGDIAFSGTEYDLVDQFFTRIASKCDIIFAPGNHDHDFSSYTGALREQLLNVPLEKCDDSVIGALTTGMAPYFNFEKKVSTILPVKETSLSKQYTIERDLEYNITSLNTAWCSSINERGGTLRFPVNIIESSSSANALNITFFHHPLSWFEPINSKDIRNTLRKCSDIIITGHEHKDDSFKVETDDSSTLMIESSSFYDKSTADNGFITFWPEEKDIVIQKYVWDETEFQHVDSKRKSDCAKELQASSQGFSVQSEFFQYLNDAGTAFSHPDLDNLLLNDLFIYPNVRNLSSENSSVKRESSANIFSKYKESHLVIIGEECCGKTSLLKKLYLDSLNNNTLPLLINGSSIKKPRKYNHTKINSDLSKQYCDLNLTKLSELNCEKIVFIDNFDLMGGDKKSHSIFLNELDKYFDRIVVTVTDTYDFNESQMKGKRIFGDSYIKLALLKLGYRLRYELINKWNSIKPDCEDSNKLLILSNDEASKKINRIIGQNYIPSTPFFLLTMLQSMDTGNAPDMNTSSYGYYYQYLITSSLGAASVKKESLDEIFNYIKELSFYFFLRNSREESYDSLWDFNMTFCNEYGLKTDCQPRLDLLVRAKILHCSNGYYSFKYPYIYFFFIAMYLSESLGDNKSEDIIDGLIETLDKRRSMSILMFLTHHSKDKSVLERIVTHTEKLFNTIEPADLNINSMFIDEIINELPLLEYEATDSQDFRKKVEDKRDDRNEFADDPDDEELEEGINNENQPVDSKNKTHYDFISELNLTFKSLDLLGQLTRNYYGSLKVDQKQRLLKEAINAPLRALESIFSTLRDDPEHALSMIETKLKEKLDKNNSMSRIEYNQMAKKILFNLMTLITLNIISKVSTSIGSVKLLPVIESISNEKDTNAMSLIVLSTKLDLGNHGSIPELKILVKQLKSSGISTIVLRSMILNYLYMFELSDGEVKQLCSIAEISYQPVSKQIGLDKMNIKSTI